MILQLENNLNRSSEMDLISNRVLRSFFTSVKLESESSITIEEYNDFVLKIKNIKRAG